MTAMTTVRDLRGVERRTAAGAGSVTAAGAGSATAAGAGSTTAAAGKKLGSIGLSSVAALSSTSSSSSGGGSGGFSSGGGPTRRLVTTQQCSAHPDLDAAARRVPVALACARFEFAVDPGFARLGAAQDPASRPQSARGARDQDGP